MEWLTTIFEHTIKIVIVLVPWFITVALYPFFERRIIGAMQDRIGPNRVGPFGILQSIADAIKLLFKEVIRPTNSNKYLFIVAPVLAFAPAISAWAVIPFTNSFVIADLNVGILYLLAMTSLGVYGIIIAGWASNGRYSFLGALRSAAQVISYEIAMAFTFLGVIMASQSMNISEIVMSQQGGILHWYCVPLFPLYIIYLISVLAETNRSPFDVAEGESELVAGFHVEYSGMAFAIFFLAEYSNMILVSVLASLMFLGGWLSPFEGCPILQSYLNFIPALVWLLLKTGFVMFLFLWFRATFPRYRYDQIMRLGWKVFIPLTFGFIIIEAVAIMCELKPWF
jgi:NADH-quinone oxidoreductase subunit H